MSISSSAVLVSLNISVWPASTIDKEVTTRVLDDAMAHQNAGKFKKDLLAGTSLRKDIENRAARSRQFHAKQTIPWADKGDRLLPTCLFLEYKQTIDKELLEFNGMCGEFFQAYPSLCAAAPVNMGKLFKREDYPDLDVVRGRFGFRSRISPLPEAGDFRLDAGNQEIADQIADIKTKYDADMQARLADAMRDPWDRLHKMLTTISSKLTDDKSEGKRYHDTLVTNPLELCALLGKLNITKDPKLEDARLQLEATMRHADIEVIKSSPDVRESIKAKVDTILGKFDW
jgi:hypothetical protein